MEEDDGVNRRKRRLEPDESLKKEKDEAVARYNKLLEEVSPLMKENKDLRERCEYLMSALEKKYQSSDGDSSDGMDMETNYPVTNEKDEKKTENEVDETGANECKHLKKNVKKKKKSKAKELNNKEGRKSDKKPKDNQIETSNKPNASNTKAADDVTQIEGDAAGNNNINKKIGGSSKSIPIITTYNINIKLIANSLNRVLGHNNYNIKILGKSVTNIGVCTLDDFYKLKNMLEEQKINFYTYTPKGLRPFSVVIKGLSHSFEEQEVLDYLGGLQIKLRVIKLVKLSADRWLLQLPRDSECRKIYDIRYILNCRVCFEKFERGRLTQCFNCQRFGHVSANCQMPFRCVKCGGPHGPGKCEVPPKGGNNSEILTTDPITGQASRRVGLPVRCANCDVEGHAASAKDCPKRVELLRRMEEKRSSEALARSAPRLGRNSYSGGSGSYASAVRGNSGGSSSYASAVRGATVGLGTTIVPGPTLSLGNSPGNTVTVKSAVAEFDYIDGDCRRFFGGSLLHCLGRMKGFAREYRGLNGDEQKSRALLGMLMSLQHDG